MPRLQKAIKEALPESEILTSLTADEVMALGCCNQAAIMGEPWDPSCDLRQVAIPVISKPISVQVTVTFSIICSFPRFSFLILIEIRSHNSLLFIRFRNCNSLKTETP